MPCMALSLTLSPYYLSLTVSPYYLSLTLSPYYLCLTLSSYYLSSSGNNHFPKLALQKIATLHISQDSHRITFVLQKITTPQTLNFTYLISTTLCQQPLRSCPSEHGSSMWIEKKNWRPTVAGSCSKWAGIHRTRLLRRYDCDNFHFINILRDIKD